jgi:uncharacterized ferritin-like protein (DUF455 family)
MEMRRLALAALELCNVEAKLRASQHLFARVQALKPGTGMPLCSDRDEILAPHSTLPGRPLKPALVRPAEVPRRSPASPEGRAALIHAVAHIEFNAINLALDAVWRFSGLPDAYYLDWLGVAAEEAHHFVLVRDHLRTLGHDYGDFPAHNGLWEMVEKTCNDLAARMALVPRTLEARGLDATPPMQRKLAQAGDHAAVAVLDVILRDEVGHVAIGNHWYRWCCEREGLDPLTQYDSLALRYHAPRLVGPFNFEARTRAGFTPEELQRLHQAPSVAAD